MQLEFNFLPDPAYQVAEIQISYKSMPRLSERPMIRTSKDCYDVFMSTWDDNKLDLQEEFRVMYLNRANIVLGIYNASVGGISGTVADPRLILVTGLKANACAMVLAHNHPSTNLKPSVQDETLTKKMKRCGDDLGITIMDHLICTREGYYSFADEGLIF